MIMIIIIIIIITITITITIITKIIRQTKIKLRLILTPEANRFLLDDITSTTFSV